MIAIGRILYRASVALGALLLAVGVIGICFGIARAADGGRIVVQRAAVVDGPTIKLGDVARLEGDAVTLADVDLGPAPSATEPRRLDGTAILRRLEQAGMDASAMRYAIPATVRVERSAQEVSVEEIKNAVLNVASDALPAGETVRDLTVAGPVRIPYEARVSTSVNGRPGRRRFDVQLVSDGTVLATVPVTARTDARAPVVVTTQPVARGAVLGPADVAVEERDAHDVPSDALTAPEQAIGMAAKVALAASAPLPRTALAAPVVVKKGDLVTLVIDTPAMRLTAAGEALEPGAAGSSIKVVNRASKQEVAGKVIEHGLVLVER
jgi:flagella basal body P-ring formation protein FlgA